jgi:hypothetical protein
LPAAVRAVPAVTVRLETAEAGYLRVHSSAAGNCELLEERERASPTVPPEAALPEDSVKLDWPQRQLLEGNSRAVKNMDLRKRAVFMGRPKNCFLNGYEATST